LKSPVLLFEGAKAMLVEEADASTKVHGGRSIFAERLGSMMIRSDPKRVKQSVKFSDGSIGEVEKIVYVRRSIKAFRRKSSPPGLRGQSSKMTPGRPTGGNIANSGYAQLLDGFVAKRDRAQIVFLSHFTTRNGGGVDQELLNETHKGSILYFPNA